MKTFDPKAFAERIVKARPTLNECVIVVRDSDLALVIDVVDDNYEVLARHNTGLDGNDDTTEAEALADRLVAALRDRGLSAQRPQSFGWTWIEGEDEQEGNEWIEVGTLDHSLNPFGTLDDELAVLMLRDAKKFSGFKPQREAAANFITSAMNAYLNTPEGKADWQTYLQAVADRPR